MVGNEWSANLAGKWPAWWEANDRWLVGKCHAMAWHACIVWSIRVEGARCGRCGGMRMGGEWYAKSRRMGVWQAGSRRVAEAKRLCSHASVAYTSATDECGRPVKGVGGPMRQATNASIAPLTHASRRTVRPPRSPLRTRARRHKSVSPARAGGCAPTRPRTC